MSTLHTVNKSSFTHSTLKSCISVCANNDGILLLEDGVFSALQSAPDAEALITLNEKGVVIYASQDDIKARGLEHKIASHIQLTNYEGFVSLTLYHKCIQSWY
ncbi:MAG: sulfur relay protein DsrH [Cellvibrio sp. 79]|nr:MAG: sulfur relay protein DsrH [Cellvibrio sp. 79]